MKKVKNILNNKLALIIAALLLVMVFCFVAYSSLRNFNFFSSSRPMTIDEIKKAQEDFKNQTEDLEMENPLSGAVSRVHDSTPHYGDNFAIIYNEEDYYFYYFINPESPREGNKELDDFLKDHGIPERSLFDGLFESKEPLPTKQPTPELE